MNAASKHLSPWLGRQRPWSLFVMLGYGLAIAGFILLPSIVLTPVAPFLIGGGFAVALAAYSAGRFRVSALRAIRRGERRGQFAG